MLPVRGPLALIEAQRGHLFPWVPVFLAVGIGVYFQLKFEPDLRLLGGVLATCGIVGLGSALAFERLRPVLVALVLVGLGFLAAGARAHLLAEPVLGFRYYGPVEGRIVSVDRSASDAVRLTLDRVVLRRMSPDRTPARVRVSLHDDLGVVTPEPGWTVLLTAHLSPPSGPVEPGGFDFQRQAWFDRLGAVGYSRVPMVTLAPPRPRAMWLNRLRQRISDAVQSTVPGEDGAFAAAIMTGDRSGMGKPTLEALRASNLSHLLAISGLHMGLLTGVVFAGLRYGLCLVPFVALRLPVKKVAAAVAMLAGGFYLALSGGNVATERAFVMVAVMLLAVLLDRRALTLRAVALAAVIVLIFRPESLPEPGFQMSFAATTALVSVFGWLRGWRGWAVPGWLSPILTVVISSAVAGLATAPVAAAHFNRIAEYGLFANLVSVPLMGIVVMPGAVLAACLTPFGLGWIGLAIMQPAVHWILFVAGYVSALDGALRYVPGPEAGVMAVLALGALWLFLWQGPARLAGVLVMATGFWLWAGVERPALLVSDTGGLVGLMTPEGRVLNKAKGEGFAAQSWLENDGDAADQEGGFARVGLQGQKGWLEIDLGGMQVVQLSGRGAAGKVEAACSTASLVILAAELAGPAPCQVIDRKSLARSGAVSVRGEGASPVVLSAVDVAGQRLWNSKTVRYQFNAAK